MPVYIRSELDVPSPTISTVDSDDESGVFVLDPEQVVDDLPQPFRMLDRIVTQLVEDTWDTIVVRKLAGEEEAKRVLPPVYSGTSKVEEYDGHTCLCGSEDTRYMFVAFASGQLVAFDTVTRQRITEWSARDCEVCVEKIQCALIGVQTYLLAVTDDMGFARMLVFAEDTFFQINVMNEQPESSPKSNATKFELSKNGDFCGLALESDGNSWLEVYKIPRDSWLKELENSLKEVKKAALGTEQSEQQINETTSNATVSQVSLDVKFSQIPLILKVKSPVPLSGSAGVSLHDAMEKAGLPGAIGVGNGHLLSQQHLQIREGLAKKSNEEAMQFYSTKEPVASVPTWHFLSKSRMYHNAQSALSVTEPVSICVWWSGSYMLQSYSLQNKTSKDPELKPDMVWPMKEKISCTAVTSSTNIIAIGLKDGSLSIIDLHLCLPRGMPLVRKDVPIKDLFIFDGSLKKQNTKSTILSDLYCLIGLENGEVLLYNCNENLFTHLISMPTELKHRYSLIKPLPNISQIFICGSVDSGVGLYNINTGKMICSLAVEDSLDQPESRISFSADGDCIYVKNETSPTDIFELQRLPNMEEYLKRDSIDQSVVSPETISERCQMLLSERTKGQAGRTAQLNVRWKAMNRELGILVHLKTAIKSPLSNVSTPMSRWTNTTGKVISHKRGLTPLAKRQPTN